MNKVLKEILIILTISIVTGLVFNFINPSGISLIGDESRYKIDSNKKASDKIDSPNFKNDPYDTSLNNNPNFSTQREKTKEGFVKPQNIGLDQAKKLFDLNALFVDGRTVSEFNAGRIKGAINIPYVNFKNMPQEQKTETMRKFNKHGIIVCYCKGKDCEVSIDLAFELAKLGFTSVNSYLDGYKDWEDAGFPIEK